MAIADYSTLSDEEAINEWDKTEGRYKKYLNQYGIKETESPEHHYDYRSAFNAGVKPKLWDELPEEDKAEDLRQGRDLRGKYTWPDEFKKEGHPFPPKEEVDYSTMSDEEAIKEYDKTYAKELQPKTFGEAGLKIQRVQIPQATTQPQIISEEESYPKVIGKSVMGGLGNIGTGLMGVGKAGLETLGIETKGVDTLIKDVSGYWAPKVGENTAKKYAAAIAQSTTTSLPLMLTGPAALPLFGLTSGGNKYIQMRDEGQNIKTSLAAAIPVGISEAVTELLPLSQLMKVGTPLVKRLLKSAALELPGEEINTLVESIVDKLTINPEMTMKDFHNALIDTAVVTIGQTFLTAGLMHPIVKTMKKQTSKAEPTTEDKGIDIGADVDAGIKTRIDEQEKLATGGLTTTTPAGLTIDMGVARGETEGYRKALELARQPENIKVGMTLKQARDIIRQQAPSPTTETGIEPGAVIEQQISDELNKETREKQPPVETAMPPIEEQGLPVTPPMGEAGLPITPPTEIKPAEAIKPKVKDFLDNPIVDINNEWYERIDPILAKEEETKRKIKIYEQEKQSITGKGSKAEKAKVQAKIDRLRDASGAERAELESDFEERNRNLYEDLSMTLKVRGVPEEIHDNILTDVIQVISDPRNIEGHPQWQTITPHQWLEEELEAQGYPAASKTEGIDIKAHRAAPSPFSGEEPPSKKQLKEGNYKKGPLLGSEINPDLSGLEFSIENPRGTFREDKEHTPPQWRNMVMSHYGYIKGYIGKDKEHIDAFIGRNPDSDKVFIVNQTDPKTGNLDEHKIMIGYVNERDAQIGYLENYAPGWKGMGSIVEMSIPQFKEWLKTGNKKKAAEAPGKPLFTGVEHRENLEKRKRIEEMTPEEKEHLLYHDDLIGLKNRRAFESEANKPVVGIIDLDGFKQINDRFGHDAGDKILIAFADAIRKLQLEDYVYRYGGDEFTFRAYTEHHAQKMTDALDRAGKSVTIEVEEAEELYLLQGVRFSYGYGTNLKEADSALYRHKEERTKAGERIPGALPAGVYVSPRPEGYKPEEGEAESLRKVTPTETTAEKIQGREAIEPQDAVNDITRSELGNKIAAGEDVTADLKEGIEKYGAKALEDALAKEEAEHAIKVPKEQRKEVAERFKAARKQIREIAGITPKIEEAAKKPQIVSPEGEAKIPPEKPKKPIKSLVAWINNKGGMNIGNMEGEFKILNETNPATKFIRIKGDKTWGIDQLAQMAHEEGLIPDAELETLLKALRNKQFKSPTVVEEQVAKTLEEKAGQNTIEISPTLEGKGAKYLIQNPKTGKIEEYENKGVDDKGRLIIENGELHRLEFGDKIFVNKVLSEVAEEKPTKKEQKDLFAKDKELMEETLKGAIPSVETPETELEKAQREAKARKVEE